MRNWWDYCIKGHVQARSFACPPLSSLFSSVGSPQASQTTFCHAVDKDMSLCTQGGWEVHLYSFQTVEEGRGRSPMASRPHQPTINHVGKFIRLGSFAHFSIIGGRTLSAGWHNSFSLALPWCLCFSIGRGVRPRKACDRKTVWSPAWPLQRE